MSKLQIIDAKKMEKLLFRLLTSAQLIESHNSESGGRDTDYHSVSLLLRKSVGFEKIRQKGSHAFYRHIDGRTTTVPFHGGRALARPLIREILREIEITVEDYNKYLE